MVGLMHGLSHLAVGISWRRLQQKRMLALTVMALFSLQLSRFFFIIQLDPVLCYDANHSHEADSPDGHEHHHEGEQALDHTQDDGFFFQHCKDTFDGIGLTPVQPLGVPVAVAYLPPTAVATDGASENPQPLDQFLPPPFQPPRSLS